MCCGAVLWPELSHGDPFVIEYFASNAWDKETLSIAEQTDRYCRDRYPAALVADMSALSGGRAKVPRSSSSFRDIWQTYWDATRMMLLPMLVMIGFLTVLFLLAALLFWLL